jgi:hypothetical protein
VTLKEEQRQIQIVLIEVVAPELMPLSERLARALLPVVLRRRLEGLVPGWARSAKHATATRGCRPSLSPPSHD